jgi:hypothetical protein
VARQARDEDVIPFGKEKLRQFTVLVRAGGQPVQQDDSAFRPLAVRQGEGQAERLQIAARLLLSQQGVDTCHGLIIIGNRVRLGTQRHRLQFGHCQRPKIDDQIEAQNKGCHIGDNAPDERRPLAPSSHMIRCSLSCAKASGLPKWAA